MSDPMFSIAAKPLAQYLAKYGLKHEIHKTVVADLYDLVNEIRDVKIKEAEDLIDAMIGNEHYYSDKKLQAYVVRLESFVAEHNGKRVA